MQVSNLTVEELKALIQEAVTQAIESIMLDPDANEKLRPEVEENLRRSLQRTQAGEQGIPLSEVAKKLGITLHEP